MRSLWEVLGEGNGTPLQYSCLENPMDGGAWKAAVHGVAEGWTRLSGFTFTFHFHALEKEMATHSSVLAWRIPGTGEPGGLPCMGSHRVGHDQSDLAAAAAGQVKTWVSASPPGRRWARTGVLRGTLMPFSLQKSPCPRPGTEGTGGLTRTAPLPPHCPPAPLYSGRLKPQRADGLPPRS